MKHHTLALAAAALAGNAVFSAPAAAQNCDPARMMVLLDQSSSMNGIISGQSKWDIAVDALGTVVDAFESKLELGLMKFPSPDQCSPGSVFEFPALNNADSIKSHLTVDPPNTGNYTPMFQTLNAAESIPEFAFDDVPNYVVLITDGWQWCSDATAEQDRFKPIGEVTDLKNMGVKTYVVGFGASADATTLNAMAVEGGTAISGCDPSNTSPSASDNCYYQADNAAELQAALTDIANTGSQEVCDGLDNDCDNKVDEGLTQACSTDCGSGTETCDDGTWVGCDAPQPDPEVCDGVDNDCDGTKDPAGCDCVPGEEFECGEESSVGVCEPGTQKCDSDGKLGECEGSVSGGNEMCNGLDDDCDGAIDESKSDGEVAPSLCGPGYDCVNGDCEVLDPMVPPEDTTNEGGIPALDDGSQASGCGCRTSGMGAGGAAKLLLGLFGMALVLRRRRR